MLRIPYETLPYAHTLFLVDFAWRRVREINEDPFFVGVLILVMQNVYAF